MVPGGEEESIQERQENEFQVLQGVFAEEIKDLRTVPQIWRPLDVVITLTPQRSMNPKANHVTVDLHVTCPETYPEKMPDILLENSHGLSNVKLTELKVELQNLARKLVGEVMILELAQHVQKYLHCHNAPQFKSFYDEMMSNKKQRMDERKMEVERQQDLIRQKEERQRKAIDDEIQKMQDALKEEARRRRESTKRRISGNDASPSDAHQRTMNSSSSSASGEETHSCQQDAASICKFKNNGERTIQRGKCLGHSIRGSVTFIGVDTVTGDPVTITEWVLKWSCSKSGTAEMENIQKETRNTLKLLSGIGHELSSLYKLEHRNLVNYLDMNYYQDNGKITVQVMREFVVGGAVTAFLEGNVPLEYVMLRHITLGVVEALNYLHSNHVVHRDLRTSCVYLGSTGTVKVSGYCVNGRLAELHNCINKDYVCGVEDMRTAADGYCGKREDVLRLGLLVLSLARGEPVTDPSRHLLSSVVCELRDFLEKCLAEDARQRWTSDALMGHEFLKCPIARNPRSPIKDKLMYDEARDLQQEEDSLDVPNILPEVAESCRLHSEFKVLKWLGHGAFGDVLMVHNKLDGGIYAIKRIILNPYNRQLNRKITREVKLLSRLNHENVVRYFNSWIESSAVAPKESNTPKSPGENTRKKELGVGWKFKDEVQGEDSSGSSAEEILKSSFLQSDSSDDIVFEGGSNDDNELESPPSAESGSRKGAASRTIIQVMYIQMEFCEKSTLRNAIDTDLFRDRDRMWRLFREIVEGLTHIHQQGMIHRDLKPVNIFLDSSDNVKIGDFGLATTSKVAAIISNNADEKVSADVSTSAGVAVDGSMTGGVGTTLYVAPELRTVSANVTYNQKVDIYSLGIILFEMCTRPSMTGMERVAVINEIRKAVVLLPQDFDDCGGSSAQAKLLRWLLDHDPRKRPTSQELLQSDLLPPPQMEETELHEMLRHTISNSQSKAFKHMVSSLLKQDVPATADITYDMDMRKGSFLEKAYICHDSVCSSLAKIFKLHGAVSVPTPLPIPKLSVYESNEYCVRLLDHGGGVVSLPYDLRVPFARLLARSHITSLKRFSMAPVYRDRKVFGCRPRQLTECAFDVVTPTAAGLVPDAEVLVVVGQVLAEFPSLCDKNKFICVNHTAILKALLTYCGVPEEKHGAVYNILGDAKSVNLTRFQAQTQLSGLNLAEHSVSTLYKFIRIETGLKKVLEELKPITRKRNQTASLALQGLHEIEVLVQQAEALGLRVPVVVSLGLMFNVNYYSGVLFQAVCETTNKRRKGNRLEVVAAGGRYDNLVSMMQVNPSPTESCPHAVGVSFAVEKIVSSMMESEEIQLPGAFDVLVCSVGYAPMLKEKSQIVQDLWAAGIKAHLQYGVPHSLVEVQEQCRLLSIPHIVILKDGDAGFARVQSSERNTFTEKKVANAELAEHLSRILSTKCDTVEHPPPPPVTRSEHARFEKTDGAVTSLGNCNISFITGEKLASNTKRRYEAQIVSTLSQVVQNFSLRLTVEILAVELPASVLKTLAVDLELDTENAFETCVTGIIDKHSRHKKYLTRLLDQIHNLKFEKKRPILVLYGLSDCTYKILM